ncbi:MAG: hypothetical protein JW904_09265 [Spirochaetales bacterium]|nr:hypothetical protein [Spirochaetales bacterium]
MSPVVLLADLQTSVDLTLLVSFLRDAAGNPAMTFLAQGDVGFKAVMVPDVKAEVVFTAAFMDTLVTPPEDILKKAYIKTKFESLRLTAGKTRVSWGDGFVFNAGDVIFGSMTPVADLSASLLRDSTDWMIDLYYPLGDFSFIETILLPYSPLRTPGDLLVSAYELRYGGRIVTKVFDMKLETGYLFRNDTAAHIPYIGVQGNLFFDVFLNASMDIPAINPSQADIQNGLAVAAGLFRMFSFEDGSSLVIRCEAASYPFGIWNETDAAGDPLTDRFGLLLYPEIAYAPMDILSFQLRGMINPIDSSGMVMVGTTFSIYQGFDILAYTWVMYGDTDDSFFGWDRQGDIGIAVGIQYIY